MNLLLRAGLILLCVILLPVIVVGIALAGVTHLFMDIRMAGDRRAFLRRHAPRRTLLVTSNSPHWKAYIEERWLPRIGDRVVLLNWSERATWKERHPVEAALFRRHLGTVEFNPAAVVFHRDPRRTLRELWHSGAWLDIVTFADQRTTVLRFWKAFRDFKHGKTAPLEELEGELFALVDRETPPMDDA